MEKQLTPGMLIWAKEYYTVGQTEEITKGNIYKVLRTLGLMFQVENNQGLRTTFEKEDFDKYFTTEPPEESEEEKSDREIIESVFSESPVFKSLDEIKDEVAKEMNYPWLFDEDDKELIQFIDKCMEENSSQYQKALVEKEKEIEDLKNLIPDLCRSAFMRKDLGKGLPFDYTDNNFDGWAKENINSLNNK